MFGIRRKQLRSDPKLVWRDHPRHRRRRVVRTAEAEKSESFLGHAVSRDRSGKKIMWFLIFISSAIVLGTLCYAVFFSGYFTVRNIIILNNSPFPTLTDERMKQFVSDVEDQNLFLVNTAVVLQGILARTVRVRTIQAERILPDTIRFTLEEYPVVAHLWQGDSNTNALVNEAGFIIALIDNPEDFGSYPTIKTYDTIRWREDMRALPHADLAYTLRAVSSFENQFGIQVERADYLGPNREVRIVTNKGWEAWLSLDRSVPESIADLILAFDEATIAKEGFSSVDLRIPGKLFVCRRPGGCMQKPASIPSPEYPAETEIPETLPAVPATL